MVENLWHHALLFLDKYRLSSDGGGEGCNVEDLYKFPDQTGLLDRHGRWREGQGIFLESEADMKILYYELIRMMSNYDREHCRDAQIYDYTKSISKIDGYQDLTNRLQRVLNQRFMLDIDELNKKYVGGNLAVSSGGSPSETENKKLEKLQTKVEKIWEDNQKLKKDVSNLSVKNQVLETEISDLKQKLEEKPSGDLAKLEENKMLSSPPLESRTDQELSDRVNVLNEHFSGVSDKLQSIINQANTLLINDATHLERISNLESQVAEINGKLSNLESADLYLQEAHKVLSERTSLIEKYSKYVEEKVNLVSSSTVISNVETATASSKYQQLEDRISSLENLNSSGEKFTENYRNISNLLGEESTSMTQLSINVLEEKIRDSKTYNLSSYDELVGKYKLILNRIKTMETLLSEQTQTISDHSRLFSDKYFPGEKVRDGRITKVISERISETRREEERSFLSLRDITKLYRDGQGGCTDCSIFDFIEILMTMNKSLNEMMEDFVLTQNQLKMLRSRQSSTLEEMNQQGKMLRSHSDRFSKLNEKLELADIKELCDYENINQKSHRIEESVYLLKERVMELEKLKNINRTPARASEEDFSVRRRSYEKLIGSNYRKRQNGKFLGLFGGKGSCCC